MGLVITKRAGEAFQVGVPPREFTITVVRIRPGDVRLHIECPRDIPIRRDVDRFNPDQPASDGPSRRIAP